MGKPSVYPTGVTIYDSARTENGYTMYVSAYGATLIDMNGRLKKAWKGVTDPVKPLPDGQLLATRGSLPGKPGTGSNIHAMQLDWNGKILWDYCDNRIMKMKDGSMQSASCHHHDFEWIDVPVYPTPERSSAHKDGSMILLTHNPIHNIKISDKPLLDERIIEVNARKEITWEWNASEHIDEMGLDEAARKSLFNYPMMSGDWIHINAVSTLGDNRHYRAGDERFHPDNLLCSSRQLNIVFLIEKKTGGIVWRLGPDYLASSELREIGQIIGQHHAHMIPEGLPGAGNILIFDNGSFGGYGTPNGCAPIGTDVMRRHYSRVLEINPVTWELKWEYMKAQRNEEDVNEMNAGNFFSAYISSVQRLENGNTLITQGADGILTEVTPEKEVVWEFINPIRNEHMPPLMQRSVYRAYRIPYGWIPQLEKPEEVDVIPPDNSTYRVPGSFPLGKLDLVETELAL